MAEGSKGGKKYFKLYEKMHQIDENLLKKSIPSKKLRQYRHCTICVKPCAKKILLTPNTFFFFLSVDTYFMRISLETLSVSVIPNKLYNNIIIII